MPQLVTTKSCRTSFTFTAHNTLAFSVAFSAKRIAVFLILHSSVNLTMKAWVFFLGHLDQTFLSNQKLEKASFYLIQAFSITQTAVLQLHFSENFKAFLIVCGDLFLGLSIGSTRFELLLLLKAFRNRGFLNSCRFQVTLSGSSCLRESILFFFSSATLHQIFS